MSKPATSTAAQLLGHLQVSRDEFLRFVLLFARLEYSLKKAGVLSSRTKWPNADWLAFARQLAPYFDRGRRPELESATDYLFTDPPRQQVRTNGGIDWGDPAVPSGRTDLERLIKLVKMVRNNLMHGGKFATGLVRDPSRNPDLLDHASTILEECVHLAGDHYLEVYRAFFEPLD